MPQSSIASFSSISPSRAAAHGALIGRFGAGRDAGLHLFRCIEDRVDVSTAVDHANDLGNVVWRNAIEDHMWVHCDRSQPAPHFIACPPAIRMVFEQARRATDTANDVVSRAQAANGCVIVPD